MDLLNQLAGNGTLALLLAISYLAIYILYVQSRSDQKEVRQELKEMVERYIKLADDMKKTLDTTLDALERNKK